MSRAPRIVSAALDTGARCNVISIKDLQRLGININLEKLEAQLQSYSGHVIATKRVTTLPCEYKRKIYPVKIHVVDIPAPTVFSANTCKKMGLVQKVFAVETSKSNCNNETDPSVPPKVNTAQVDELLKRYDKLFTGLGCLPGEHTIEIDPSYTPVYVVHPSRRVPLALKEQIKGELQSMVNMVLSSKKNQPIGLTAWSQLLSLRKLEFALIQEI